MSQTKVEAIIRANVTQFVSAMSTASGAVDGFKKKTDTLSTVGDNLIGIGKGMTMGITLPLVGLVGAAIKTGNEFEAQMSRVQAIAGATGDELKALSDQAIDLGASTSFSAGEVALGMENMASAGFTVEEIMASMAGVLDLAAVSGGDVAMSSEAVATAIRQFGLEAGESSHVANVFARAAADTNAETTDMAEALKYAGPIANTLGLSLEETAAAIGIMADMGIKGSQAGTTLRGAFTSLANPTKEASELMEALGINVFDANGDMKPMGEIIGQLQSAFSGMTSEQQAATTATLFGRQAMSGMLGLVEAGPDKFNALNDSLENSSGAAQEMADIILNNVSGAIEEMGGAIETAAINIQQILAPVITEIVEKITELVNKFNELSEEQQQNILKWVGIAAAIGPLLLLIGGLFKVVSVGVTIFNTIGGAITAFKVALLAGKGVMAAFGSGLGALMGPAGWITLAILALVAAGIYLWQNWDTVKEKAGQLKEWLLNAWETIKTTTVEFVTAMVTGFKDGWERIVTGVSDFIERVKQWFIDGWNTIKETVTTKVQEMYEGIQTWWNNIVTSVTDFIENVKQGFIEGWNTIKESAITKVQEMYEGVILWFENIKTSIGEKINGAKETAVTSFTAMKDGILEVVGGIVDWFVERFGWLGEHLSTVWEGIKMIATGAWELIKIAVITPVLALLQIVTGDFEGLKASLSQIWENIKTNASLIWEGLKTAVIGVISGLYNMLQNLFTNIKNFAITAFENTKTKAIEIWNNLKTSVVTAVTNLKTSIIQGFQQAKENAITLVQNTKTSVVNGWNNLKTSVVTAVQNLKTSVINFFTETKTNVINKVAELKTSAVNKFNELKTAAINAVIQLKDGIIQWFNNAKTSATTAVTNLKTSVTTGFTTMVTTAIAKVKELPSRIRTTFNEVISAARSFISRAVTAGKDLIMGFVTGIKDKAGQLVESVKGAIDGAIAGAKKLLGIKSPSRVFAYFAKMTTKGYGDNIKRTEKTAIRPIEGMMEKVKDVFGSEELDFGDNLSNLNARANAQVDYVVSDNMSKAQPQIIYLNMDGKTYRAHISDLTKRQDRAVKLEEAFL